MGLSEYSLGPALVSVLGEQGLSLSIPLNTSMFRNEVLLIV